MCLSVFSCIYITATDWLFQVLVICWANSSWQNSFNIHTVEAWTLFQIPTNDTPYFGTPWPLKSCVDGGIHLHQDRNVASFCERWSLRITFCINLHSRDAHALTPGVYYATCANIHFEGDDRFKGWHIWSSDFPHLCRQVVCVPMNSQMKNCILMSWIYPLKPTLL